MLIRKFTDELILNHWVIRFMPWTLLKTANLANENCPGMISVILFPEHTDFWFLLRGVEMCTNYSSNKYSVLLMQITSISFPDSQRSHAWRNEPSITWPDGLTPCTSSEWGVACVDLYLQTAHPESQTPSLQIHTVVSKCQVKRNKWKLCQNRQKIDNVLTLGILCMQIYNAQ